MSNFVHTPARTIGVRLTTTALTTVFTATGHAQVINIHVANVTAIDRTVTVIWRSAAGATDYRLLFQHPIPANGAIVLTTEAMALSPMDEVRIQASAANVLDATLTISEVPGRSG